MDDTPEIYSQEEINAARDEIKNLTPEDYLSIRDELIRAQANQTIPEAVAVCFTEIFSDKGTKINITCRGMSGRQALDELADSLRYAREKYGMHPTRPQTTEPPHIETQEHATVVPTSPTPDEITEIQVTSIARERKRDGKGDFLKVRGGMYTLYGVPAYDNVYPKGFDITKMQYSIEETRIPPEMAFAKVLVKKPGARVLSFHS